MSRSHLSNEQRLILAAMLFIILGLLLKVVAMNVSPVHWDTNYYLNIGSNFIERGELTPYMWRLGADTKIIAGSGTGYGVLILLYWFKIFGLSLYSGYSLMYVVGIVSLVVLFFLAREWWQSSTVGIVAVVFTVLTGSFISQFYIRMDALAVLAYLFVLWLHIYAVHQKRNWLHFVVGVAIIATAEIHIQVLVYIGAISFYYLLQHIQHMRQQRSIFIITASIYYFAGAFIAGVIYLFIHVVPDPEAYFIIARQCINCEPAGFLKEFERILVFVIHWGAEAFVFVLAIAIAFARNTESDHHYLTLVIGFFLAQAIISPPAQIHYVSHTLPLMSLGVGGIFLNSDDPQRLLTREQLVLCIFGASFLLFSQFAALGDNLINRSNSDDNAIAYIRSAIPTDTVVMADPPLYHRLLEYDQFLTYRYGEEYGIALRDEDYLTFWEREQPQVFVGEVGEDDAEWLAYMIAHDFQRVRENVWVAGDLLGILITDREVPEIRINAGETRLKLGDCTLLEWSVTNADIVVLNGEPKESTASQEVCPYYTTTYTLTAFWVGGMETETLTLVVE